MKKYAILAAVLLLPAPAFAANQSGVTINDLNVNRDLGQVFLRTSSAAVANGCHTDTYWNYTFLISTEADKAVYSTLLAAKMAGKVVNIVGYGACPSTGYDAVEELRWVTIAN